MRLCECRSAGANMAHGAYIVCQLLCSIVSELRFEIPNVLIIIHRHPWFGHSHEWTYPYAGTTTWESKWIGVWASSGIHHTFGLGKISQMQNGPHIWPNTGVTTVVLPQLSFGS
jgi:hypothetical protein